MAASIGLPSKELGRDGSLPLQDHHRSTTLRSESAQSAQRGKDRLQCAQSNDKFGYVSLRSEEVTGGSKMTARIAVHSRTNAIDRAKWRLWHGCWTGCRRKLTGLYRWTKRKPVREVASTVFSDTSANFLATFSATRTHWCITPPGVAVMNQSQPRSWRVRSTRSWPSA